MSAASPEDILFVPGRLSIDPTNYAAAWPYGGTAIGMAQATRLKIHQRVYPIWAQEWGCVSDLVEQGEEWLVTFEARALDEDLLGEVFNRSSAGSKTGLRTLDWQPLSRRPGGLRSARACQLLFTPDSPGHHRAILFRQALPVLDEATMDLEQKKELVIPVTFRAVPVSSGVPAEWVHLRELQA